MTIRRLAAWAAAIALMGGVAACGRDDRAPDLLKTQRDALQKAKDVSQTLENADEARRKQADDDSR